MSDRARWQPTSAWPTLELRDPHEDESAGIRLVHLDQGALATIIVRNGQEAALERLVQEHLGCGFPAFGKVSFGRDVDLVWSAPGQWLAVASNEEALGSLSTHLADIAAVTDQSDSRALLQISGPRARETLTKGFAIDLHPSTFAAASTAVTKVAHLSVQIWQTDDAPTFVIAVPRSFAGSFWAWMQTARAV